MSTQKEEIMDTLGERIKEVRKKLNLKQKDFAKRLLVSTSYISKVETNVEIPTDTFLKLISYEFNVPFEILTGYSNDISENTSMETKIIEYSKRYYKRLSLSMSSIIENADSENIRYVAKSFGFFVGLVAAIDLSGEDKTAYYEAFFNFIDTLEKLQFFTRNSGKVIKKDYKNLLQYRNRLDEDMDTMTKSIKNMLRVYIKKNDMDIQI